MYGSYRFLPARRAAGSFPVYDWGDPLSTPPGQNVHLPWGQGCGEAMTATTAVPLAVRMGFLIRSGSIRSLSSSDTSASYSEIGRHTFQSELPAQPDLAVLQLSAEISPRT